MFNVRIFTANIRNIIDFNFPHFFENLGGGYVSSHNSPKRRYVHITSRYLNKKLRIFSLEIADFPAC